MPPIQDRQVQVKRAIIKIFYLGGFKYKDKNNIFNNKIN